MGHGGMSCGMKTLRFFMVLFNIIFLLIGLALLGFGIYVKVDPSLGKLKQVLPINGDPAVENNLSYLDAIAIAIIVLGCVLVVIGFLGCCGAMKQVKIFLVLYAIVIGIIIAIEIGVTIYFVAFKSKFEDQVIKQLQTAVKEKYQGPNKLIKGGEDKPNTFTIAWDLISYNLKCCGVYGSSDLTASDAVWDRTNPWYNQSSNQPQQNFTYPITCCDLGSAYTSDWNNLPTSTLQSFTSCAINGTGHHATGCYPKVMEYVNSAKTYIIIVAVIILVIELAAMIFTLALCCHKRKERYSS